ncbi:hypothetical protein LCGC14_2813530 [marine sediment metagenome]|uniref:Apea-like HEPN domain-containing protein n=1 Tax=marine sediment metagenome TaxID=412755 RepID=A0A0F8Z620_9ZZZZ
MNMHDDLIDDVVKILYHGIDHLEKGTNFDLQIAMISIDNAIELGVKGYLGVSTYMEFRPLLTELRQKKPNLFSRRLYQDIKYFHSIRNQIYHEVKVKKVRRRKTALYASLANQLISKLFSRHIQALFRKEDHTSILVDEFMKNWYEVMGNLSIIYAAESDIVDFSYPEDEMIDFAEYNGVIRGAEYGRLLKVSLMYDKLKNSGIIDDLIDFEKSFLRTYRILCDLNLKKK